MIVNTKSIEQHVIQIKNEIMINANKSVKIIKYAKKIIIGIQANVFVKMENI